MRENEYLWSKGLKFQHLFFLLYSILQIKIAAKVNKAGVKMHFSINHTSRNMENTVKMTSFCGICRRQCHY